MTAKIHGFTVKAFDENDGAARLLDSSVRFGGVPQWVPLDEEALAGFVQRQRPPWGHCWHSSRDLAEDAAREVRGIVCAIEVDEGGAVALREIDPVAEAVLAEREACAALVDSWPLDSEPFGSREFGSRVFEAVAALAARIRARGQK